jgi:hypothetical protein
MHDLRRDERYNYLIMRMNYLPYSHGCRSVDGILLADLEAQWGTRRSYRGFFPPSDPPAAGGVK